MLTTDLHVHLYGCLTPFDIWDLARDTWHKKVDLLGQWERRMASVTGSQPDWRSFWTRDDGLEKLAEAWSCRADRLAECGHFDAFEARFGLAIALFPIGAARDDLRVLNRVMNRHLQEGRRYVEYRYVYPPARPDLQDYSLKSHLEGLCQEMANFEAQSGGAFQPRLALSLDRCPEVAINQYNKIKAWQAATGPLLKRHLTAVDFSGAEHDFDSAGLEGFCEMVHRDNHARAMTGSTGNDALALLIHAGESIETGPARGTALRRIQMAAEFGAHRIGHAVALSSVAIEDSEIQVARDEALSAVLASGSVIECCLSSNLVVAGVKCLEQHPLPEFLQESLPVTLATDDPGMFATTGQGEFDLALQLIGREKAESLCARTDLYRSEILSGRES